MRPDEFVDDYFSAGGSPVERAQALDDMAYTQAGVREQREREEKQAKREEDRGNFQAALRRAGHSLADVQRQRSLFTQYDDEVRQLEADLEKKKRLRGNAERSLQFFAGLEQQAHESMSRSADVVGLGNLGEVVAATQAEAAALAVERRLREAPSVSRSRRPKDSGDVVRSEYCVYCTEEGVDDETSYLLHSDPQYNVPVTTPEQAAQADRGEVDRLVGEGYSYDTAVKACTPIVRTVRR